MSNYDISLISYRKIKFSLLKLNYACKPLVRFYFPCIGTCKIEIEYVKITHLE